MSAKNYYTVLTIGHSGLELPRFIDRLQRRGIDLVVDVRSYPYSTFAEWFNRDRIENSLRRQGIEYVFMGSQLGALTEDGRFDYIRREKDHAYQTGISRLLEYAQRYHVALMSSEGDYRLSHRHHLIAQTLLRLSVNVVHITEDDADENATADLFHSVKEEA